MNDLWYLYNENYLNQIINSSSNYPGGILGKHLTQRGCLISVFNPQASYVQIVDRKNDRVFETSRVTDNGLFAALIGSDTTIDYFLRIYPYDGEPYDTEDCYNFPVQTTAEDAYLFGMGTNYQLSDILGAHLKTINGVSGTLFTVWAPNAMRVSVVGDFNNWDGRIHQMNRVQDVGIFELFIPNIGEGSIYKYEIKTAEGLPMLKSDPFGNYQQLRPDTASIITDLTHYDWTDKNWLEKRKKENTYDKPMSIYELHLSSWRKGGENKDQFLNYREIAPMLAGYVTEMGYTHIELMGISEHPFDGSWGYQVTGYYAPTSRYGSPEDFMYFVDYMHKNGISVILDWVPAHFPKDAHGLGRFDGTPLYEHPDTRRGEHPDWGTYIFNYEKNEVRNFLISSALFWVEKFHIDGLRVDAVASMLYLDYGKQDGNWLPNQYGGRENLDAVAFLKHLNSIMQKRNPGALVIAEESTAWPGVTTSPDDDGLGFSYKWNMGWMNDFLSYMSLDPIYRQYHHNQLTFSMVYAYSEKFVLVLSHDEVVYGKCSMINKMPGYEFDKFSNLKTAYGFMFGHPGKKLLFMGQDFGQNHEWEDYKELDWQELDQQPHKDLQTFVKDLLHLYKDNPALYQHDYDGNGFGWTSCDDNENSQVSFVRKSTDGKKSLLFICNFTPVEHTDFPVAVPCPGKYKQILNSDDIKYGGKGRGNVKTLTAEHIPVAQTNYSFKFTMPPLSVNIFEYTHLSDEELEKIEKAQADKKVKAAATKAEKELISSKVKIETSEKS